MFPASQVDRFRFDCEARRGKSENRSGAGHAVI